MSIRVGPIVLPFDADDAIAGYGGTAYVYLEKSATENGSYAAAGSALISVASGDAYYVWDATGDATTWYRSRIGNGTQYSDYSDPFQATATPTAPVSIDALKRRLGITDAKDDAYLSSVVASVNDWVIERVGMDISPAGSATRTLDGDGTREVFVPGGLRSVATVEVSTDMGSTWADVTASVTLLPESWRKPPSEPHHTLRLSEASGDWFPDGEGTVRITSTEWGYERWPDRVVEVAETIAVRMANARNTGQRDVIGSDELGNPVVSRFVSLKDRDTIDGLRFANSDFGYV